MDAMTSQSGWMERHSRLVWMGLAGALLIGSIAALVWLGPYLIQTMSELIASLVELAASGMVLLSVSVGIFLTGTGFWQMLRKARLWKAPPPKDDTAARPVDVYVEPAECGP